MSWLFSQALVEEYLEVDCSDGKPSAQLSVMPTPHKFWRNDKTMEFSSLSLFGLTCAVLTESRGEELLTSYLAAFPVRTLVLPEVVRDYLGQGLDCGEKWQESLVRYSLDSSSWKTHQCLFTEDLQPSSVTLPRWGLMRNGFVYQHKTQERPISVTEYGLWPTPNACEISSNVEVRLSGDGRSRPNKLGRAVAEKTYPTATATAYKGWSPGHNRAETDDRLDYTIERAYFNDGQTTPPMRLNPDWVEWLMGWPTGWTDLRPLEMGKFQEWQRLHSLFDQEQP